MNIDNEKYGSIDPKQLIIQNGEDISRIAADEFSPGKINISEPESTSYVENHPMVDGLPVIGVEAENIARQNEVPAHDIDEISRKYAGFSRNIRRELPIDKAREMYYDAAGAEAMANDVSRRAIELVTYASENLKKEIGETAKTRFLAELDAKKIEKQAAADAEAQILLDKLKSGAPLSEIIPELTNAPESTIEPRVPETGSTSPLGGNY